MGEWLPRGMREKGREGRQERAGEKNREKGGREEEMGERRRNSGTEKERSKKAQHSTRNERFGKEMKMGKMLIVFRLIPNLIKVGGKFLKVTWKLWGSGKNSLKAGEMDDVRTSV